MPECAQCGSSSGGACPSCGGRAPLSSDGTMELPPGHHVHHGPPASGALRAGESLDRFEIVELLGAGGFGEVYLARDQRLHRTVALKILPDSFAKDAERRERLRREAEAACALNHPGICTVHDLVEVDGRLVLVMEHVPGKTLHQELAGGPFGEARARDVALQLLDALGEAHRAGILHRDVKASNVLITPSGRTKLVDFGLAKLVANPNSLTADGTALGTLHTMSPEQLLGRPLDARSDLFSFGVVLYEMLSGRLPFRGTNAVAVADAILHRPPEPLVPPLPIAKAWRPIVDRLLRKEAAERFASADEVAAQLRALPIGAPSTRRPRLALAAAGVAVLLIAGLAAVVIARQRRASWARRVALPEVERLLADGKPMAAFPFAREAAARLPDDAYAKRLLGEASASVNVASTPPGAAVSYRLASSDAAWTPLGTTPLSGALVPRDFLAWKLEKPGYEPVFRLWPLWLREESGSFSAALDAKGALPTGMVRIPGGTVEIDFPGRTRMPPIDIGDYFIDRTEVTNREFKRFVDAGGYSKRELWKEPFVRGGRTVPFEEAIAAFTDRTGRPGPAGWELGAYPSGEDDLPVAAVSFYEAAAYAAFAGKALPTIYHWRHAAEVSSTATVSPRSNFEGRGPRPAGRGAMNAFGTYDMAGNVKEWCLNESDPPGSRYILGGGFGEPPYMFLDSDAQPAWDRKQDYGFRGMKPASDVGLAAAARPQPRPTVEDWRAVPPLSDDVFKAYKALYAYDRVPLDARVEKTDELDWARRERVTVTAASGRERLTLYVFLPKGGKPPYQVLTYFPGSNARYVERFEEYPATATAWMTSSGRAFVFPVYKGTFERRAEAPAGGSRPPAAVRDDIVAWTKEVSRAIDYVETRRDLDASRLGYYGVSWGASLANVILAVEPRPKAAILVGGGFGYSRKLPEVDRANFAPRVTIPVLMMNGRFDHDEPLEASQRPMFDALGTPADRKRLVLFESGHVPPYNEVVKQSIPWLDRWLGPVAR